jgi:hypothetical protein
MGETAIVLAHLRPTEKSLEIVFAVVFSVLAFAFFFALLSSNGLILGNDPAVHLGRAETFLADGRIPLSSIAWYPPLYHILLAALIAFTGATSIEQMLFLMKSLTALIDVLLLFSVYLLAAKFFGKKYGVLASALLLLCFPLYEINFWGGYTSILALAFMCLLFLYLSLARKGFGPILMTFVIAFSLVLSHQLATFLTAIILPPFIVVMLIKSRGRISMAWIAAILGGALAFFLYYFQAIASNIDILISHLFFDIKTMLYQVPVVTLSSFVENFGFIFFFAFLGVFLAFFKLREEKKLGYFLILFLSLFVPLFFSQSYLFGLFLPYQWFIYYMLPPMAIFAAVSFSFIIDLFFAAYWKLKNGRKRLMKVVTVSIFVFMFLILLFRFETVGDRINKSAYFYSVSDVNGYDAAVWLRDNFPNAGTTVVTQKPGSWFGVYSGRYVIAATDPVIDRNVAAESVLDLSYEIEHPITLVRAYEAKGDISDGTYVSINNLWRRVSYLAKQGVFLSYRENGVAHKFALSDLGREIVLDNQSYPKKFVIKYFNAEVVLTESILVQNDSYPISVVWTLSPLRSEIDDVTLYLSNFFDLSFSFEKAYVPGLLNWENPWSKPSYVQGNNEWAVVNFTRETLKDNYISVYDETNEVAFALKFVDLPDWGNVGVLPSMAIDAFRFQYQFDKVNANHTASSTYQILTFSQSSFPERQQLSELKSMFDFKSASAFDVTTRNYMDYIKQLNIEFVVYDKNRFDAKLLSSEILQLVYSNDKYVICRVKSNP